MNVKVNNLQTYLDTNLLESATWQQGLYESLSFSNSTIISNTKRFSTQITLPDNTYQILLKLTDNAKITKAGAYSEDGTRLYEVTSTQTTDWEILSNTPIKYIRFTYGLISNDDISSYNEEVFIFINGISTLTGIGNKITNIKNSMDSQISEINNSLMEYTLSSNDFIKLDSTNLELGSLTTSGKLLDSTVRVRSKDFINITSGKILVYCKNPLIEYEICVYRYDGYASSSSDYRSGDTSFTISNYSSAPNKIKFLIKFKKAPYDMSYMDLDTIDIFITECPLYGNNIKLTLMAHNCGKFNYGLNSNYSGEDVNDKIQEWKNMIIKTKPDIIFAQEFSEHFDDADNFNAYDTIYKPLFPFTYFLGYGRIMSKIKFGATWQLDLTVTYDDIQYDRQAGCAIAVVDGIEIILCSVHLNPGHNSPYDEVRALQQQILISAFENYDYVIMAGDFNSYIDSFYETFINAGYQLANHGYFGVFNTTSNPIDNIIVKGFNFYNVTVDADNKCTSDHTPIIADAHISLT